VISFGPPRSAINATTFFASWRQGDSEALERLIPPMHEELTRNAQMVLSAAVGTLHARAIVHDAYLQLISPDAGLADRAAFMSLAARLTRRILTDHASGRNRLDRARIGVKLEMTDISLGGPARPPFQGIDVLALDEALDRLAQHDRGKALLLEVLYFGGLTYEEAAQALGLSRSEIGQELHRAKAWIARALAFTAA
jgi:RNA polymerase sigma-70 factor (ECF subfamily)